jgi:hypothetical protein
LIEGKVVNCVGLKSEKSVLAKYSVKPERENSQLMKCRVIGKEKINLRKYSVEVRIIAASELRLGLRGVITKPVVGDEDKYEYRSARITEEPCNLQTIIAIVSP